MIGFFVAIEGPTGIGKTALATRLAAALDAVAVYDPFDANPFLADLLASGQPSEALALRVELSFFALRIAQLREIAALLTSGRTVVADWALLKQPIFAATTLGPADVAQLAAMVRLWAGSVPRPDVLIGLSAATSVIQQRIRQRGRAMEAGVTCAHLDALSAKFGAAYAAWDGPLIRLDASSFNTFCDPHVHELADRVHQLTIPLEM